MNPGGSPTGFKPLFEQKRQKGRLFLTVLTRNTILRGEKGKALSAFNSPFLQKWLKQGEVRRESLSANSETGRAGRARARPWAA